MSVDTEGSELLILENFFDNSAIFLESGFDESSFSSSLYAANIFSNFSLDNIIISLVKNLKN